MLYRFTGFCSYNGKQFDEKDKILIEANSDEDAKSEAYNKLKKLCGVKPQGQFAVQRLVVERQYTEDEIRRINYQEEVNRNREIYLQNQQNEINEDEEVKLPFTDFEEEQTVEEVVEEQPKKTTRKKKTTTEQSE